MRYRTSGSRTPLCRKSASISFRNAGTTSGSLSVRSFFEWRRSSCQRRVCLGGSSLQFAALRASTNAFRSRLDRSRQIASASCTRTAHAAAACDGSSRLSERRSSPLAAPASDGESTSSARTLTRRTMSSERSPIAAITSRVSSLRPSLRPERILFLKSCLRSYRMAGLELTSTTSRTSVGSPFGDRSRIAAKASTHLEA